MSLAFDARTRTGGFSLDARFEAGRGVTALFGPSGAGKTTVAQILAGLVRPDDGRVTCDGQVFVDTARGVFVPPHRRRLGCVFQDGRLFPHLTVAQNLRYGRWFAGRPHRAASLDRAIDVLGLAPLLPRMPGRLSGGEQQRVAIGRALAADPRLLVLDEPLSGLDARRRLEVLPYLERLRDETGLPMVYITHSADEIARLAATVVVLAAGRVEFAGPVRDAMARLDVLPIEGAEDAGAVVEGRVAAHDAADELTRLAISGGELIVPRLPLPVGTRVRTRIRSRDVMIATARPDGLSAQNVLPARVLAIDAEEGAAVHLRLACGTDELLARVTRRALRALDLAPGRAVFAVVKSLSFDPAGLGVSSPRAPEDQPPVDV
jgi:molybdate transport system ATP-binding protein